MRWSGLRLHARTCSKNDGKVGLFPRWQTCVPRVSASTPSQICVEDLLEQEATLGREGGVAAASGTHAPAWASLAPPHPGTALTRSLALPGECGPGGPADTSGGSRLLHPSSSCRAGLRHQPLRQPDGPCSDHMHVRSENADWCGGKAQRHQPQALVGDSLLRVRAGTRGAA